MVALHQNWMTISRVQLLPVRRVQRKARKTSLPSVNFCVDNATYVIQRDAIMTTQYHCLWRQEIKNMVIIMVIFKCYFSRVHIALSYKKGVNIELGKTNRLKALRMMKNHA